MTPSDLVIVAWFQAQNARETKAEPIAQRNSSFSSSDDVRKYIIELGISKVSRPEYTLSLFIETFHE